MTNKLDWTDSKDMKEQARIAELQQQIQREKNKLDKKLTRQKILLGAFLIETLKENQVQGLGDYVAKKLPEYLTRATDRELLKSLVEQLGGTMEEEKPGSQQYQEPQQQDHGY